MTTGPPWPTDDRLDDRAQIRCALLDPGGPDCWPYWGRPEHSRRRVWPIYNVMLAVHKGSGIVTVFADNRQRRGLRVGLVYGELYIGPDDLCALWYSQHKAHTNGLRAKV